MYTKIVERIHDTKPQKQLNPGERKSNLKKAFRGNLKEYQRAGMPKRVLLVDDIYTTGLKELTIIDGQQRLTTITLIFIALYHKYKEANNEKLANEIYKKYLINEFAEEEEEETVAEEKNEEQNTETDIICNWPEDIIDPGPALPQYLSAPKIMNILNTNKGIKVQWKKVNNAHGYRIQRKLGNSKWKDLKILKENQYTDKTVENGKKYQYKIYAYASNSIDFIESTGTKSTTKKIWH